MCPRCGPRHYAFEDALRTSGLHEARQRGQPVVALHVRHGDSCSSIEARRTARNCEPLSVYINAIERLANASAVQLSTIFLATDDPAVLNMTASYPQYTWLRQPGSTELVHLLNPGNRFLDTVIQQNSMKQSRLHNNMQLAWSTTLDAMLLASCDLFVGKFTSSLFRLSYELHAAECDCAAPFISLDSPWCYGWMEMVTPHGGGLPRSC